MYADIENIKEARQEYDNAVDKLAAELQRKREEEGLATGWYVLLRRGKGERWESLGCVCPFLDEPETIPEDWEVVLSIPDPTTIPEFTGF